MQSTNLKHAIFKKRNFANEVVYSAEVVFPDNANRVLPVQKFQIDRDIEYMAQNCVFELHNVSPTNPNFPGYYSPDMQGTFWNNEIWPGKRVQVRVKVEVFDKDPVTGRPSYYTETFTLFSGYVDTVVMNVDKSSTMKVSCRDPGCILLDNMIPKDEYGERWLSYSNMDVGAIIRDLVIKAGFSEEDVAGIDVNTGIVIDIEFENSTFADCIATLTEICGYEFFFDENGKAILRKPFATTPEATLTLTFTNAINYYYLGFGIDTFSVIIPKSEVVKSANGTQRYYCDVDYTIDYAKKTIFRTPNSSIPIGEEIKVSFKHTAYHFKQGEDLYSISYQISRNQVYGEIKANGYGVDASYFNPAPTYYGVTKNKVLMVPQNIYLDDEQQVRDMVNRLGFSMIRTYRKAEIVGVGIPWLQFGDCLQITDDVTTISEIYRITAISFYMEKGMLYTRCRTYYYDHSPY